MDDAIKCPLCAAELLIRDYVNHIYSKHGKSVDLNISCPAAVCANVEQKYRTAAGLKSHWNRLHHLPIVLPLKESLSEPPVPSFHQESEQSYSDTEIESGGVSELVSEVSWSIPHFESISPASFDFKEEHSETSDIDEDDSLANVTFDPEEREEAEDSSIELQPECSLTENEEIFVDDLPLEVLVTESQEENYTSLLTDSSIETETARFVLGLKTKTCMTETALSEILSETSDLVKCILVKFASDVDEFLVEKGVKIRSELLKRANSFPDLFSKFKSANNRDKLLAQNFSRVKVLRKTIGVKGKRTGEGEKRRTVLVKEEAMYIPIFDTLRKLTKHPDFNALLQSQDLSPDSRIIDSYLKSESFKRNQFLSAHPDALRIVLSFDELEICNVLGAMAGKQKLGFFYYYLDNIPLQYRSNLNMIQLAAVVNANFLKDQNKGMDVILKPIVDQLKILDQGISFKDGSKLQARLIAVIGDNLGLAQVGGFKEGFTANCPCRFCLVTTEVLHFMVKEDPSLLRTRDNFKQQVSQVKKPGDKKSVEYGINRDSILNTLDYYNVVEGLPEDGHHDILQGVLELTMRKLLAYLVKEKLIKLKELNDLIANGFDYGYSYTKPSEIKPQHLEEDGNLRQSAIQMWYLGILLPLFIGMNIPDNCPPWDNFIQLLEICKIIFSPSISESLLDTLPNAIELYLSSFLKCYDVTLTFKQHSLCHYPTLIKRYGPPVHFWAMRVEAKHKVFKRMVAVLQSFRNVPWTLANLHEWRMAFFRSGSLLPKNKCGPVKTVNLVDLPYCNLISGCSSLKSTEWVLFKGILLKSKRRCYVVINCDEMCYPVFALVIDLIVSPEFKIICQKVVTELYNTRLCAYRINAIPSEFVILNPTDMKGHTVFHSHVVGGSNYIPMRYCIGDCL